MDHPAVRNQSGFSLIEVCIAAGLLGAALVNLAVLFTTALDANLGARHRTYATVLAQQKLERLRIEAPGAALPLAGFELIDRAGRAIDGGPLADTVFARRWSIEWPPGAPAGLALLQVEVRRHPPDARAPAAVSMATLIRRLP
jgi:hypothetical protein